MIKTTNKDDCCSYVNLSKTVLVFVTKQIKRVTCHKIKFVKLKSFSVSVRNKFEVFVYLKKSLQSVGDNTFSLLCLKFFMLFMH